MAEEFCEGGRFALGDVRIVEEYPRWSHDFRVFFIITEGQQKQKADRNKFYRLSVYLNQGNCLP